MTLRLRYAAKSDVGLLREGNEDSAYAGPRLLAVADGMGGHAHGEVASARAITTIAPLDEGSAYDDAPTALERSVQQANDELRRMVESDPSLEGMGTTLTAILWDGERSAVVHIGDSRGYLLREGQLYRITRDHTLVQSLIDEGRIDEDEAAVHPQRSLLLRALDGRTQVEPDVSVHDSALGDRYLLCSDGLSGVVSEDTLRETLNAGWDPERVVQQLIELANRGGGPDNITCVVADVIEGTEGAETAPFVAGAAAHAVPENDSVEDTLSLDTSAGRAAALMRPHDDADEEATGETAGEAAPVRRRRRRRWPQVVLTLLVVVAVVGGAGYSAYSYVRSQFYVGARDGEVVIFRGITPQVAGRSLSQVHARTGLSLTALPTVQRSAVSNNIQADSLHGARQIVHRLQSEARACASPPVETPVPTPDSRRTSDRDGKDSKDSKDAQVRASGPGPAEQQQPDRKDPRQEDKRSGSAPREQKPEQPAPSDPDSPSPEPSPECPEGVTASDG